MVSAIPDISAHASSSRQYLCFLCIRKIKYLKENHQPSARQE
jgi:hypothetical protein